jgi:hypothetical protein
LPESFWSELFSTASSGIMSPILTPNSTYKIPSRYIYIKAPVQ